MHRRELIIRLPKDAYRALERLADREERAADQQASFMLRRAILEMAAANRVPSTEREAGYAAG